MRHRLAFGLAAALSLAACAPDIPQIAYDDPKAPETEPSRPVNIVQRPELLQLPGQLKRLPRGRSSRTPEPQDPARRVQLANAAASINPTRGGYATPSKSTPTATARCTSSTSLRYTLLTSRSSPVRS